MTKSETSAPRFQRHHVVAAIVAIVVAIAVVLNYYLW
jgi:hypothetical protein